MEQPDPSHFSVKSYTGVNVLKDIIRQRFESFGRTNLNSIWNKFHFDYFSEYCGNTGLNIKTILVEKNYIDHAYLDDYSQYYVRCFTPYPRECIRVHFFDKSFDQSDFTAFLIGESTCLTHENLQESYKGFSVIKPLPETIFGRTCLATYPEENNRKFPITREYEATLFGIPLTVRSLAFQEQDKVVAICATSALWSVFQGTGKLFHHPIPSPIEITKIATNHSSPETKSLIKDGLKPHQIATAIREVGLEPYVVEANDQEYLKNAIYSYIGLGIPLILGFSLVDTTKSPNCFMGKHAVAVTGYRINDGATSDGGTSFLTTSSRIEKLYVHDDQVGPFARMEFDSKTVDHIGSMNKDQATKQKKCCSIGEMITRSQKQSWSMYSSWKGGNGTGSIGSARAVPDLLFIPLYHKIRISYHDIYELIASFDSFLSEMQNNDYLIIKGRIEWDIKLETANAIKNEVRKMHACESSRKLEYLTKPTPKYIWRANGSVNSEPIIDIFFDATDIVQGRLINEIIEYDDELNYFLRDIFKDPQDVDVFHAIKCEKFHAWYCKEINHV